MTRVFVAVPRPRTLVDRVVCAVLDDSAWPLDLAVEWTADGPAAWAAETSDVVVLRLALAVDPARVVAGWCAAVRAADVPHAARVLLPFLENPALDRDPWSVVNGTALLAMRAWADGMNPGVQRRDHATAWVLKAAAALLPAARGAGAKQRAAAALAITIGGARRYVPFDSRAAVACPSGEALYQVAHERTD